MTTVRVPFNEPGRDIAAEEPALTEALAAVLESGWLVHGQQHATFEAELSAFVGVPHAVGVASGTDALELALRSLDTGDIRRRVVVTVANAGGYTTAAAHAIGLTVRLCDVDPATHLLDPAALPPLLGDDVRAVVVTHLYGRLADVGAIRAVCDPLGIPVVEDCAQAIGARSALGAAGSLAAVAAFSFYPTKNLGALGDGGAVTTSDGAIAERVRALRQYGWASERYRVDVMGGRNSRLDEIQSAVLRVRLPGVAAGNEIRRRIIARYAAAAPDSVRVLPAEDSQHSGHLAVCEAADAAGLKAHLRARGVDTAVHYPVPDHRQAGWRYLADSDLPVTDALASRILTLPCFPRLADEEIEFVCDALDDFDSAAPASRH